MFKTWFRIPPPLILPNTACTQLGGADNAPPASDQSPLGGLARREERAKAAVSMQAKALERKERVDQARQAYIINSENRSGEVRQQY